MWPSQTQATYAGIGSRETPPQALALMEALAVRLSRLGWVVRTGMSPGADQAFYRGALAGGGLVELYLPWPGFEARARFVVEGPEVFELAQPSGAAYEMAARFHPRWSGVAAGRARHLLARDVHQVLGADLATPARLVVCWTADGSLDGVETLADGTGQALRVADRYGVRVLNLGRADHIARVARVVFEDGLL